MNTLKNLIVTGMLLFVAYGAFVVLKTGPAPPPLGDVSSTNEANSTGDDDHDHHDHEHADADAHETGAPHVRLDDPSSSSIASADSNAADDADPNGLEIPPYRPAPGMEDDAQRFAPTPSGSSGGTLTSSTTGAQSPSTNSTPSIDQLPPVAPIPEGGSEPASTHGADFEAVWRATEQRLADNELGRALTELSMWYHDTSLTDEQRQRTIRLLDDLAATVIYSRESYLEPPWTVQPGETLEQIAARHHVTVEFLAKVNGIPAPYTLSPGESIKVLTGPFEAEVDARRKELTMFLGRCYAGRFAIELGGNLPPGNGDYEVAERTAGHPYFDRRTLQQIAAGAPGNPFGNIWLGLRGSVVTAAHDVGIHARGSVTDGMEMSGVIVAERDAQDVFSILTVGSPVRVRR